MIAACSWFHSNDVLAWIKWVLKSWMREGTKTSIKPLRFFKRHECIHTGASERSWLVKHIASKARHYRRPWKFYAHWWKHAIVWFYKIIVNQRVYRLLFACLRTISRKDKLREILIIEWDVCLCTVSKSGKFGFLFQFPVLGCSLFQRQSLIFFVSCWVERRLQTSYSYVLSLAISKCIVST